jgi:hypothetical protein
VRLCFRIYLNLCFCKALDTLCVSIKFKECNHSLLVQSFPKASSVIAGLFHMMLLINLSCLKRNS